VSKIIQETNDPNSSTQSVERLLSSDQALASKVLRVVNSAYYGLSGQVTSLSQATMILGMLQVRNLVLSVSAMSTIKPKTSRQQEIFQQFWLHSFGAAAATQIIAKEKRMRINDAEGLFLGGLLHDIGLLFLYHMFAQTYDQVVRYAEEKQIPTVEAEQRLLGLTHSEIGATMAARWNLPNTLVTLINDHEGPFDEERDPTVYAVHVSDHLTRDLYDPEGRLPKPPLAERVADWMQFDEEQLNELKAATDKKIEEAKSLFGVLASAA
jgi:HD-like signal output (HDOD) protein